MSRRRRAPQVSPAEAALAPGWPVCSAVVRVVCTVTAGLVLLPLPAQATGTAPPPGSPPDSLSIRQCVERARDLSPEVQAAALDVLAARYDSTATVRSVLPGLGLAARATIAPDGFYDPAYTNLGQYELLLGLTWPVTGPRAARRQRDLAHHDVRAAVFERDRLAFEAAKHAAELAVGLLRLQEQERAQGDALRWLEDLSVLLASQVRGGSAGPADRVRVSLEADAVRAGLEEIRVETAAGQRELALLTGLPGAGLCLRAPGPEEDRGPSTADSVKMWTGLELLPAIRSARNTEERASLEALDTRGRNGWRLELAADAGLAGTDLTEAVPSAYKSEHPGADFGQRLGRDLGASLSFDLHRPLFDATQPATVASKETGARAATLRRTADEAGQEREARDLLERWRVSWRQFEAAKRSVFRAEENLLRLKSRYAAGASGILDLLDARRVLDEARNRLAEARAEARLVRASAEARP
jgi:outer membrane protein TolC